MKILIVGAGTVGQVYGCHFQWGGADVYFYVKEKYRDELIKEGFTLFPLNKSKKPKPLKLSSPKVLSHNAEIKSHLWDAVVFTIPSDALYTPWFSEFATLINKEASIISLQPVENDFNEFKKYFPLASLISGVITLIAFYTPLDKNGPIEKGVAFWLPPFTKSPFDGEDRRVSPLVKILKKSGFPAIGKDIFKNPAAVEFAGSFLLVFVVVLRRAKWKLNSFQTQVTADLFVSALKEAFLISAKKFSVRTPPIQFLINRYFLRILIKLCLFIMPFDLEKYLSVHFTKVEPQMNKNLNDLILTGKKLNLKVPQLEELSKS
ncbi:MAG: hypothetical protein K2P81_05160 [Bacteriovoracaceae bacterium]|nr:hypothetical protein [Bacteriovoracaceae bacterium]